MTDSYNFTFDDNNDFYLNAASNWNVCMENNKEIAALPSYKLTYDITLAMALGCMCICSIAGVVGNSLVIWIAGFKMKTVSAVWFINLAIVDFIYSITLSTRILNGIWSMLFSIPQGFYVPIFSFIMLYMNSIISVCFLTAISIDRCVTIIWPLWAKIHRSRRLATISSVFIWLVSLVIVIPCSFVLEGSVALERGDVHAFYLYIPPCAYLFMLTDCRSVFKYRRRATMFMFLRSFFMFGLALSIILVCYGLIVWKLCSNTMRRPKRFQKTFRIIIAVVVCFFVCWFPYNVWPFIASRQNMYDVLTNVIMSCVSLCLVSISSCINPILYVLIGQNRKLNSKTSIRARIEHSLKDV